MFDSILKPIREWQQQRRQHRVATLTAKAADLDENRAYDLLFLHERGFVRAKGTGQSITQIRGEVENLIAKTLRVTITPGTYFVAKGDRQNMVTRREYTFTLHATSTQTVAIDAACINANRPIPGKDDRFHGVRRVSDELARFLEASKSADAMTVQAGVWALTDNYTGTDVKNHLVLVDQHGTRRPAVDDANVAQARRILAELGIKSRL